MNGDIDNDYSSLSSVSSVSSIDSDTNFIENSIAGDNNNNNDSNNLCENCDENLIEVKCEDCSSNLCKECSIGLHKSSKMKTHRIISVLNNNNNNNSNNNNNNNNKIKSLGKSQTVSSMSEECENCEEEQAVYHCVECEMALCQSCSDSLHKPAKMKSHKIKSLRLNIQTSIDPLTKINQCEKCNDALYDVTCDDCQMKLCNKCNLVLHLPQSMNVHKRRKPNGELIPNPRKRSNSQQIQNSRVAVNLTANKVTRHTRHVSLMKTDYSPRVVSRTPPPPSSSSSIASLNNDTNNDEIECENCEEHSSTISCEDCDMKLCQACNEGLHKPAKMQSHKRKPLQNVNKNKQFPQRSRSAASRIRSKSTIIPSITRIKSTPPSPMISPRQFDNNDEIECENCEEHSSTISCEDCDMKLCQECNEGLHKPAKMQSHKRKPLNSDDNENKRIVLNRAKSATSNRTGISPRTSITPRRHVRAQSHIIRSPTPTSNSTKRVSSPAAAHVSTIRTSASTMSHVRTSSPPSPMISPRKMIDNDNLSNYSNNDDNDNDNDDIECENCEEHSSTILCEDCDMKLCQECNEGLHKPAKMQSHKRISLTGDNNSNDENKRSLLNRAKTPTSNRTAISPRTSVTPRRHIRAQSHIIRSPSPNIIRARARSIPASTKPFNQFNNNNNNDNDNDSDDNECENCEEHPSIISCEDCDMKLCQECDEGLHKPAKMQNHKRKSLSGDNIKINQPVRISAKVTKRRVRSPSVTSYRTVGDRNRISVTTAAGQRRLNTSKLDENKSHKRTVSNLTLPSQPPTPPRSPMNRVDICNNCQESIATIQCLDESKNFCTECDAEYHSSTNMATHHRIPLINQWDYTPYSIPSPMHSPNKGGQMSFFPSPPTSPYPFYPYPMPTANITSPLSSASPPPTEQILEKFKAMLDESNKSIKERLDKIENVKQTNTENKSLNSINIPSTMNRRRSIRLGNKRASISNGNKRASISNSTDNQLATTLNLINQELKDTRRVTSRLEERISALSNNSSPKYDSNKRKSIVNRRKSVKIPSITNETTKSMDTKKARNNDNNNNHNHTNRIIKSDSQHITMALSRDIIQNMLESTLSNAINNEPKIMNKTKLSTHISKNKERTLKKLKMNMNKHKKKSHKSNKLHRATKYDSEYESDTDIDMDNYGDISSSSLPTDDENSKFSQLRKMIRKDAKSIQERIIKHSRTKSKKSKKLSHLSPSSSSSLLLSHKKHVTLPSNIATTTINKSTRKKSSKSKRQVEKVKNKKRKKKSTSKSSKASSKSNHNDMFIMVQSLPNGHTKINNNNNNNNISNNNSLFDYKSRISSPIPPPEHTKIDGRQLSLREERLIARLTSQHAPKRHYISRSEYSEPDIESYSVRQTELLSQTFNRNDKNSSKVKNNKDKTPRKTYRSPLFSFISHPL